MKKILIGSCGGLTGLYLVKLLKTIFFASVDVIGFDANIYNPTKLMLDKFLLAPKLEEGEKFILFLERILNEEAIDIYFPTYSKEVEIVSKNQTYLKEHTLTHFLVSDYDTIQALENKEKAYHNLSKIGIMVPEVYKDLKSVKYPLFAKPRKGSGSKKTSIIYNKKQLASLLEREDDILLMELLSGMEYTVDAVFDMDGELIAYNQRTREKTLGGAVIVTKNNFDVDCYTQIVRISRKFKIKGPCNFQFFLTKKGIFFTDINLRFASGGMPLSVASGVNIPEILIKLMSGESVMGIYSSDKKKRIMYRYFEELFEIEE